MNSILILAMGAACGYLTGNPKARVETFKQIQKISGMAIDGLNKQGEIYEQKPNTAVEQPEQSKD